jgi:hydroxyethylthiazole kinase-like sugar kinase family protein
MDLMANVLLAAGASPAMASAASCVDPLPGRWLLN